jgi:prepilin-type N-terminal cleavage/methylation domain-containing protein
MNKLNTKGFTLIELLIVVVIIGILAAIAIPRFGETRDRAFVSAMQSDLNQVRTAQEMWFQDNAFEYTDDIGDLEGADLFSGSAGVTVELAGGGDTYTAEATHAQTDVVCEYDEAVGTIDCA